MNRTPGEASLSVCHTLTESLAALKPQWERLGVDEARQ